VRWGMLGNCRECGKWDTIRKGLCGAHYWRSRTGRGGTEAVRPYVRGSLRERIAARTRPDGGCLIWTGAHTKDGYGNIRVRGESVRVHRLAYTLSRGPVPDDLVLDHLCRRRDCVNPDHMEPVTNKVNILRGEGACARNARVTECPAGHPYDEENTYVRPDGRGRECRACKRNRPRGRVRV
jgi:hypothetical protein